MTESKIELTERLRREGREDEAKRFRETVIKECRAAGMKRDEAREHAWGEMAKAYPPLPIAEQNPVEPVTGTLGAAEPEGPRGGNGKADPTSPGLPEDDLIDVDALLERVGDGQPPDLARDTVWAYENLANRNARPEDAPSLGAWSLLQWARRYKNRFFEMVLPKAMATRPNEGEEMVRRERKSIEEIERILGRFEQQLEEELLRDTPATIRERAHGLLSDWIRRFGLSLPDDAQKALHAHVAKLVDECVEVLAHASGGE
jgi:hypothetical protein